MRFSTTLFQQGNNTGIEVPADVVEALAASPAATAAWDALSPSAKKAHVTAVEGATAAETRARRVEGIIAKLS